MAIPTALLRRFYVGKSLTSLEDGFQFQLANRIAPTTILSLGPIEVDGEIIAPDQITVQASKPRPATAIRDRSPLFLRMGKVITLTVTGKSLPPGHHQIIVHALTKEVGPVSIEFDDTVS